MRYISAILVLLTVSSGVVANPAFAQSGDAQTDDTQYTCFPAIRVLVDLGYCYGFVHSYYIASENRDILDKMAKGKVEDRIRKAHEQCYPTNFNQQQVLGELAFSSYMNLSDPMLMKQSAQDCSTLLEQYSAQTAR